ncbi:partial Tol-Pal system protein TolB, partial [Anaerolineales bacterium]
GYSPPEQYGTARTDPRTDIYSLGATLYAAMCGVIPEDGLARAMDNAQLTPLRKRNPKVSRRFAAAIEKAMAVDPSDRFQSAEEFKKALLGSSSKTQLLPGGHVVEPPPPEAFLPTNPNEVVAAREKTPQPPVAAPIQPPVVVEEQPFVSPLKKQKERERKRRAALMRFFVFLLLLLMALVAGVAVSMPAIIPSNVRSMIPFLLPTNTVAPTVTPSPLPTQTLTPAPTATFTATSTMPPTPTATILPTNTGTPLPTETAIAEVSPTVTENAAAALPLSATPMGGSGQVAYVSDRSGLPQIYLVDLATQNLTQITDMSEGACQPSWSPDGQKLVFISPCKGKDEIYYGANLYIINVDGSNLRPIVSAPGSHFDPAWSPDGKFIAFTSMRTGKMEIFVLDANDLVSVNQTTNSAKGVETRQPAWSPDGTKIVYVVKRFGVYQIWLMNADGTQQMQIVRSGVAYTDYLPAWSPDGQVILFNQRCATKFCFPYLLSISAVDRTVEQGSFLSLNVITIEDVGYSPDGFYLVYEGEDKAENKDIYYMSITGSNIVRITTDEGLDFDPAWRPSGD